ncbi:MAG: DUF1592 domain-containing protein [Deltaproteobacteria bacterium]|nr:DUF1592 domain-containing protein [Deltaproteobacteria bacterium]
MSPRAPFALLLAGAVILSGCAEEKAATTYAELEPAAAVLPRLTKSQYQHTISDVFGDDLALPAQLEPDTASWGLLAVGASVATVSSRGVELYEEAARSLAQQIVAKPGRLGDLLPCTLPEAGTVTCTEALVARYAPRLWRRPATTTERDRIVSIAQKAHTAYGTEAARAQYALVALLQSPNLLYRTELGKEGVLDAWELAGKLALFLWDGAPDDALLAKAADASLLDDATLRAEAERMIADPRFARAVRAFADQWLHLDALDGLNKDPNIFKHFSADLGGSARQESERLFAWLVIEQDADIAELLTTRTTFVDRRLAAIYDIPAATDDGFGQVELPAAGLRRGFLGQVAFLGLHSHPVSSSATLRGAFIREALLCQQVPLPPSDLNTAIPQPSETARTLKDRLLEHMSNPSCFGCHHFIDPPGFGLENFDGIGRFRSHDNGAVIDAAGEIDDRAFDGPLALYDLLAESEAYRRCVVQKLYGFANGHRVGQGEYGTLDRLDDAFAAGGRRLKALAVEIATDPSFRRIGAPGAK